MMTEGRLRDHASEIGDFSDTAALMEEMDLIISVDTSIVHLAGALGKPVWVLLPYVSDYRWMGDREDSPWYPTARLFRQTGFKTWDRVIETVKEALIQEIDHAA
jgi:ADP-heptose:LPS heptosyltransferase